MLPLSGDKGQLFQPVSGAVAPKVSAGNRHDFRLGAEPLGGISEALVFPAIGADFAQVTVGNEQIIRGNRFLSFGEQGTVFADQALAGEDQILGGFRRTGGAIGIGAVQGGGLVLHQLPAVGPLADGLIGGGQVHDDLRPGQGQHS